MSHEKLLSYLQGCFAVFKVMVLIKYSVSFFFLKGPGMSDVSSLPGISGLSFDSPFSSPLSFFCLVLLLFLSSHFSSNGPLS